MMAFEDVLQYFKMAFSSPTSFPAKTLAYGIASL
jgi:hypothetical protein